MAELRRAQKRKRDLRRGGVVGGAVIIALVLAGVTSGAFGGSSTKAKTTTAVALRPTPGQLTPTAAAALNTVNPPAVSPDCMAAPPAPTGPTTTVPAKGNAVATIAAPSPAPFPALDGSAPHYTQFSAAPPFCIDVTQSYTATITTDLGPMTVQLLSANAPVTVNNFVYLAGYHYFDGIVFHRVVKGFVDQGGDPTGSGSGSPGYKFGDELPKSAEAYDAGSLAMANSGPNTNGSQFFVVVEGGAQQLGQPAYSMFGQVINGINIMNKINADGGSAPKGTPAVLHRIKSVTIQAGSPPPPTTTTAPPPAGPTSPTTTPPASTPPASTPPASTPPASTPPASTPPASTPPST
ncbi:MAG: peptidylprolyl isomerase [Actinomycetota bacterium]|nr:peptidylprolyl isomerase [Actinomycetota bacterium]